MKTNSILLTFFVLSIFTTEGAWAQNLKEAIGGKESIQNEKIADCTSEYIASLDGIVYIQENEHSWNRKITTQRIHNQSQPLDLEEALRIDKMKQEDLDDPYLIEESESDESNNFSAMNPVCISSFNATSLFSGNPPDNTMAISNGGYIVAAVNSRLAIYNSSGQLLGSGSLYDLFKTSTTQNLNFFDPVVLYDSGSDRFVFVCVAGNKSHTSRVIVAFSKSNNPTQGWNVYTLTGNPLNNGCWFDYPKIGVSTNEIYITGNLFNNSNVFNQSVIYQIPKKPGYNNSKNLPYQIWYNINNKPGSITPLSWGGQGNYGPGCFLVAHSTSSSEHTFLYNLTDDMSATNEQLKSYTIKTPKRIQGTNAAQKGTKERLDIGDNRIQGGFYQDGFVHFVYSSRSTASNPWQGIQYHRINISNLSLTTRFIGTTLWDYSYPSVAWSGKTKNDKSVMISFLRSNTNNFPGSAVIEVDNNNNLSPSLVTMASGAGFVNMDGNTSTPSRWGDYIQIVRKKNTTTAPRLWSASCFGNTANQYTTKITQVRPGGSNSNEDDDQAEIREENLLITVPFGNLNESEASVYPNPVSSFSEFSLKFTLQEQTPIQVRIVSINGSIVHTLLDESIKAGETTISFNQRALSPGMYFVHLLKNQQLTDVVKLIVTQ